jgi:hypothetical protein
VAGGRWPVAENMALAIAGATAIIGVSPAPADGRSGRSTRTTSMDGKSLNRGHPITREGKQPEPLALPGNGLEQRAAEGHHGGTFHLADHSARVDNCPAFVRSDDPLDLDRALFVDAHLGAGRHPAPLLEANGHAASAGGGASQCLPRRRASTGYRLCPIRATGPTAPQPAGQRGAALHLLMR